MSWKAGQPSPNPNGRPSTYDEAIADENLCRLAEGEMIRQILKDEGMPSRRTLFRWQARNPGFRQNYIIAQGLCADCIADEAVEIAKAPLGEGNGKLVHAEVNRNRLICDVYKWRSSKLFPKRYSEKYQVSGADEGPIASSVVNLPLTSDEVKAHFRQVLEQAEIDMNVTPPEGATETERVTSLMQSGQVLSPGLYELMHSARNGKPNGKADGSGS